LHAVKVNFIVCIICYHCVVLVARWHFVLEAILMMYLELYMIWQSVPSFCGLSINRNKCYCNFFNFSWLTVSCKVSFHCCAWSLRLTVTIIIFLSYLILLTYLPFYRRDFVCEKSVRCSVYWCRYIFVCNDWIKVRRDISKRSGKALKLETVEESQLTAVKSTHCATVVFRQGWADTSLLIGTGGNWNANVNLWNRA